MRVYSSRTLEDRFNEKWTPEPFSGCWLWTAGVMVGGYGQIFIRSLDDGRKKFDGAHRVSWRLFKGEIPEGMFVCHRCDTQSCVNPDHLFLGTAADNTRDSIQKGRFVFQPTGTGNYWPSIRKIKGKRKTECKRGHSISGGNVYIGPDGRPQCISCIRIRRAM